MTSFPDTSFLCALYRQQDNSAQAARFFARMSEPLHASQLLLYEFRQSTRFQIFLHSQDKRKGFGRTEGEASLALIQKNIADGALVVIPADWTAVHAVADRISAQYTLSGGHRAFDILHVATALYLGAKEFLSFDARQRNLAKAEGLQPYP